MLKVRATASALLAGALAVTIAGCSFTNGDQILPRTYDPSDGVGADVGELDVRNALLISGEGDRGNLVVSIINPTEDAQPLSVQYESASAGGRTTLDVSIPGNSTVTFGYGDSDQLVLEGIDTTPGSLFPVYFQSGSSQGADLQVPVLDTTLAEYDGLTPSPTPTPTPARTPTASPVPAPTPTQGTIDEGDNTGTGQPGDAVDTAE